MTLRADQHLQTVIPQGPETCSLNHDAAKSAKEHKED
ncbi:MAG: hypothetical protein JWP27_1430 [Flaviaesturariibacter sp.]|nr:hypothetical protein [Flaviaesturariibacter sp.]